MPHSGQFLRGGFAPKEFVLALTEQLRIGNDVRQQSRSRQMPATKRRFMAIF